MFIFTVYLHCSRSSIGDYMVRQNGIHSSALLFSLNSIVLTPETWNVFWIRRRFPFWHPPYTCSPPPNMDCPFVPAPFPCWNKWNSWVLKPAVHRGVYAYDLLALVLASATLCVRGFKRNSCQAQRGWRQAYPCRKPLTPAIMNGNRMRMLSQQA